MAVSKASRRRSAAGGGRMSLVTMPMLAVERMQLVGDGVGLLEDVEEAVGDGGGVGGGAGGAGEEG